MGRIRQSRHTLKKKKSQLSNPKKSFKQKKNGIGRSKSRMGNVTATTRNSPPLWLPPPHTHTCTRLGPINILSRVEEVLMRPCPFLGDYGKAMVAEGGRVIFFSGVATGQLPVHS